MSNQQKNAKELAAPETMGHFESISQDAFRPCVNIQCDNYDPLDPDENNCNLLFAVSKEGCAYYYSR